MCLFFKSEAPIYIGAGPKGLLTADLNADGHTEVIVVEKASHQLVVLGEDGRGGFNTVTQVPLAGSPESVASVPGGLVVSVGTGGDAEMVRATSPGHYSVSDLGYVLQPGTNLLIARAGNTPDVVNATTATLYTSGPSGTYPMPAKPTGAFAADLTNTGPLSDVVTSGGGITVLLPTTGGGLSSPVTYVVPPGLKSAIAAPMSASGRNDIVVANLNKGLTSVEVLHNDGTGHFGPPTVTPLGYSFGFRANTPVIASGHLLGPKTTDIVVASDAGAYVLLGDGHGGFGSVVPLYYYGIYLNGTPTAITLTPLTHSGRPDIVLTYSNGTLQVVHPYLAGGSPLHKASASGLAAPELALGLGLSLALRGGRNLLGLDGKR